LCVIHHWNKRITIVSRHKGRYYAIRLALPVLNIWSDTDPSKFCISGFWPDVAKYKIKHAWDGQREFNLLNPSWLDKEVISTKGCKIKTAKYFHTSMRCNNFLKLPGMFNILFALSIVKMGLSSLGYSNANSVPYESKTIFCGVFFQLKYCSFRIALVYYWLSALF